MRANDQPNLIVEYVIDDYAVHHLEGTAVECEMFEGDTLSGVMGFWKDDEYGRMFQLTEVTKPERVVVRTWIGNVRKIKVS